MEKLIVYKTAFLTIFLFAVTFNILFFQFDVFWAISLGISSIFSVLCSGLIYTSPTLRCVMQISAVSESLTIKMIGPQSRLLIISVVSGLLVTGPMLSITYNLYQVQMTSQCVGEKIKEHTQELKDTYLSAYKDMSRTIEESVEVWKNIESNIDSAVKPLRDGFLTAKKEVQNFENAVKNAQIDCSREIDEIRNKCEQGTQDAYNDCLSKVSSFQTSIWTPIKNVLNLKRRKRDGKYLQYICEPVNLGKATCSPFFQSSVLCSPFSAVQVSFIPTIMNNLDHFVKYFTLSIKPNSKVNTSIYDSGNNLTQAAEMMREEFDQKFSLLKRVIGVIRGILGIPFFLIPIFSFSYLCKAKKLLSFSKKITNFSTKEYIRTNKFFLKDSKKEKRSAVNNLIFLITHLLFTVTIFSFDYLLYYTQNVIEESGSNNYTAVGKLEIHLEIEAGAVLQPVIDTFVKALSHESKYNFQLSTTQCLPHPKKSVGVGTIILTGVLYTLAFASFIYQGFLGSIKRRIVLNFLQNDAAITDKNNNSKRNVQKEKLFTANFIPNSQILTVKVINKLNKKINEGY